MIMNVWNKAILFVIAMLVGIWTTFILIMSVSWKLDGVVHRIVAGYEWFWPTFLTTWLIIGLTLAWIMSIREREPEE